MCGSTVGGLSTEGIDVSKETVIQGIVSRGDAPVAGAYVRLLDAGSEFTAEVQTSATGVYRLAAGARTGEWVSAVKDTGRTSRFGAFRWEGDVPAGTRVEFAFRSGESSAPDNTWSPWTPFAERQRADRNPAPAARYMQIKVRMSGDGARVPAVRRIEAAYRNRNAAPAVDTFTVLPPNEVYARSASGGAASSASATSLSVTPARADTTTTGALFVFACC